MATPNFSALLPDITHDQMSELANALGINRTQVVIRAIHNLYNQETNTMSKAKYTYYAYASNDQGATIDVEGRTNSLRAIENASRAQLGSGWKIHVMGVQHDGDSGWFPPVEIKTFRIR